ncbi:MAG: hypothetical protein ACKVQK_19960 [Burkholderiales bacterium]
MANILVVEDDPDTCMPGYRPAAAATSGRNRKFAQCDAMLDQTMSISSSHIEEARRIAAQSQETVQGSVLFADIRKYCAISKSCIHHQGMTMPILDLETLFERPIP